MRLPRFRLRTLMIAIGIAALVLSVVLSPRWGHCRAKARYHDLRGSLARGYAGMDPKVMGTQWVLCEGLPCAIIMTRTMAADWGHLRSRAIEDAEEHRRLARRFRLAMWCPWLAVPPDPQPR